MLWVLLLLTTADLPQCEMVSCLGARSQAVAGHVVWHQGFDRLRCIQLHAALHVLRLRWQALLVVLDSQPFAGVGEVLLDLADPRITLHTHEVQSVGVLQYGHGALFCAFSSGTYQLWRLSRTHVSCCSRFTCVLHTVCADSSCVRKHHT